MTNELYLPTRAKWRAWLRKNHATASELWLVFYKKDTGRPTIPYDDAVEEALCFGWIDGIKKKLDDERYAYRFSPRKTKSKWSPTNLERAKRMIAQKQMAKAGREAYERRESYVEASGSSRTPTRHELPPEMEKAIRANRRAWKFFESLAPSYRERYIAWLVTAKREETRRKRLRETIAALEANRKPGMM